MMTPKPHASVVKTSWDAAQELAAAGLRKAAAIASEIAAGLPSMASMAFCPYLVPPYTDNPRNQTNISHWQRIEERRKSERELKRQGFIKAKPKN